MPSQTPAPDQLLQDQALIEEAAKKSSLVWISAASTPGENPPPPRALWHVWADRAVTVVAGGDEQPLPPFVAQGKVVEVSLRSKDNGGRLVSWLSQVEVLRPGTPEWDAAATALRAERLNLPEGDPTLLRWGAESTVFRLKPAGAPLPQPAGSGAARPAESSATTLGRQPKMIGGVRRSAR
jgi:hypothetical protein